METKNKTQVRGEELKEQMKKSELEDEQYRASHQGADITPDQNHRSTMILTKMN